VDVPKVLLWACNVRFAPIATVGYQDETPGREYQEQTPFLLFDPAPPHQRDELSRRGGFWNGGSIDDWPR
jgi:hypothetical protein